MANGKKFGEAVDDISSAFAASMGTLGPQLCKKYGLTGEQLNIAIGQAAVANAAMAVSAAAGRGFEFSKMLCERIDEVIQTTLDEG